MLGAVHARGEQGWNSGHLEPFFCAEDLSRTAIAAKTIRSASADDIRAGDEQEQGDTEKDRQRRFGADVSRLFGVPDSAAPECQQSACDTDSLGLGL